MAATLAGRRLTEAYRLAQIRLGAQTVAQMRAVWRLLDPTDLDGTFEQWLVVALPVIQAQRSASSRLAAEYLDLFATIEGHRPITPVVAGRADTRAVTTSLMVTGPVSIKRAVAVGAPLETAIDVAEASSAAAAVRHVLNGGRETVTATAPRYQRVTSGKACAYCSSIAGITFQGDDIFKAHDGCACSAEPVFA